MHLFFDNQLIQTILSSEENDYVHDLSAYLQEKFSDQEVYAYPNWTSLFTSLGIDSPFKDFPVFDEKHELYHFIMLALNQETDRELLIRLYDQVFVECLTQIKAMPFLDPTFLVNLIQEKRAVYSEHAKKYLLSMLMGYEAFLTDNTYQAIHDLTLYLAWDRVCVYLATVIEQVKTGPYTDSGMQILLECLVESFQHITAQRKSAPSFFRLIETLYAYEMREERFHMHSDEEWEILSLGATALTSRDTLPDLFYVDKAIVPVIHIIDQNTTGPIHELTLHKEEKVTAARELSHRMIQNLKQNYSPWHYRLNIAQVTSFKVEGKQLKSTTMIYE